MSLIFITLILMITACGEGSGGSAIGGSEKCSYKAQEGYCEGRYNKVTGTFSKEFENPGLPDSVMVEAIVSVEEGVLRVIVESPEGEKTQTEAFSGNPILLSGIAKVNDSFGERSFQVIFEAVDGSAIGVSYDIRYWAP